VVHALTTNNTIYTRDQSKQSTSPRLQSQPITMSCSMPVRIGLSSVLRPLQHSIGYMRDGFYRSATLSGRYWRWWNASISAAGAGL